MNCPQCQDCSSCGHRQTHSLADRVNRTYSCPCCGIVVDRDYNASRNILGLAATVSGVGLAELRNCYELKVETAWEA